MELLQEIKKQRRRKIMKVVIIISSICMVVSILSLYTLIGLVYQPKRSINHTYTVEMADGSTQNVCVKATWIDRNNLFFENDCFTNLEISTPGYTPVIVRSHLDMETSLFHGYGHVQCIVSFNAGYFDYCDIWIDHDGDWIVFKYRSSYYYVCREDGAPSREKILSKIGVNDA